MKNKNCNFNESLFRYSKNCLNIFDKSIIETIVKEIEKNAIVDFVVAYEINKFMRIL